LGHILGWVDRQPVAQVLHDALADKLYTVHDLTASDLHTIQTRVTDGICYLPIPAGTRRTDVDLLAVNDPVTGPGDASPVV
jgi:hypothetical protein